MFGNPAIGKLYYNGYTFDGSSRIKAKRTNVRDEADRTTTSVEIEITVQAIVASGDGSDVGASLSTIYEALTHDGGVLEYTNAGFSNGLIVNAGPVRDLRWGPKPRMIQWEPIGSHGAAEIVWTVTTRIPCCESPGSTNYSGIMELNYEAAFSINENADTTRTISGYFVIAQTRQNNANPESSRNIPDSADNYWQNISVQPPVGFTRQTQRQISKDKSRCDFTIIDRQIPSPNAYPPGVTAISGKFNLRVARASLARNRTTLTMTIQPNRGISGAQAWQIFLTVFAQRKAATEGAGLGILIMETELEEDLFGRPATFRLEYLIFGVLGKQGGPDFIQGSGLWKPLQTRWQDWQASLSNSVFNPRGNAGLTLNQSNDQIIDPCGRPNFAVGGQANVDYPYSPPPGPIYQSTQPTPDKSYIAHSSGIVAASDYPTAVHPVAQSPGGGTSSGGSTGGGVKVPDPSSPPMGNAVVPPNFAIDDLPPFQPPAGRNVPVMPGQFTKQALPAKVQQRGVPHHTFHVIGHQFRVGFPVQAPVAPDIAGCQVVEKHRFFHVRSLGVYGGVEVYRGDWNITYVATGNPTKGVQTDFNPVDTQ